MSHSADGSCCAPAPSSGAKNTSGVSLAANLSSANHGKTEEEVCQREGERERGKPVCLDQLDHETPICRPLTPPPPHCTDPRRGGTRSRVAAAQELEELFDDIDIPAEIRDVSAV